jgi:hypothetical protein
MRKRWIHDTFDAYQKMKAEAEDDDMSTDGAWHYFCTFLLVLIVK